MTYEREARYTSKGTILLSSYSGVIYACGPRPRALAAMHFDLNPCHPMHDMNSGYVGSGDVVNFLRVLK